MADEKAPQPEQTAGTAAAPAQEAPKEETPKQEAPKEAPSGDSGRGIGLQR